jgi:predicted nucleic acid-binding protein
MKRERAQQILLTENWGWSVQIANEFFVNATSAKRPFRLATPDALALLEAWFAYPILDLTPALVRSAVDFFERHHVNYWDAGVLAAAQQLGCHTVYSEDLNHGQTYDRVTVINPFLSAG